MGSEFRQQPIWSEAACFCVSVVSASSSARSLRLCHAGNWSRRALRSTGDTTVHVCWILFPALSTTADSSGKKHAGASHCDAADFFSLFSLFLISFSQQNCFGKHNHILTDRHNNPVKNLSLSLSACARMCCTKKKFNLIPTWFSGDKKRSGGPGIFFLNL